MFVVDRATYRALWSFVAMLEAAGWAAFGLAGHGNQVFLTVMVVVTIVLTGGLATLVKRRAV